MFPFLNSHIPFQTYILRELHISRRVLLRSTSIDILHHVLLQLPVTSLITFTVIECRLMAHPRGRYILALLCELDRGVNAEYKSQQEKIPDGKLRSSNIKQNHTISPISQQDVCHDNS
jgi:hypothetical protein